jgi:transcriptional regulator with XRE-family HTH domain
VDFEHAQIGRRVRELRKWRRLEQKVVAGLAGLSPGYLSLIERGQRPVTKRSVLEALAAALRVSPAELTGQPYPPGDDGASATQTAMAALGDLLGGWWVGEIPDAAPRPLDSVLVDLNRFHAARNSSGPDAAGDYPTQVATLAPLIRDLLAAAADPNDGRRALAPLLTAYHVAGSIAVRLGIPGMPSLAADRMRQVAEQLDDPVWTAVADWGRSHFLGGTARQRQYDLAVAAADAAPAERPETRGMAHLTAALAAAAQDRGDDAELHLAEAGELAELVEPDTSPWPSGVMQFGRTNVAIFRVTIGVELGRGAQVAEYAADVRPGTISRGRQATYWMEFGRGMLTERWTRDRGLAALLRAEQLAPQQVHHNPLAREAVTDLLVSAHREAGSRELRGLAWRMGIAPTG